MKPSLSAFILAFSLFFSLTSSAQERVMYQNQQSNAQDAAALLAAPAPAKAVVLVCSCAREDRNGGRTYVYKLKILARNGNGEMQQFDMGENNYDGCLYAIQNNPACPKER